MKELNNLKYFDNVNEFLKYLHQNGVTYGRINAISAGGNGFYVFLWNGDFIDKIKLSNLGVRHVTTEMADKLIEKNFNKN